jgi:hypothetical protein
MKTIGKWCYLLGMLVMVVGALAKFSNEWVGYLLVLAGIIAGVFYKEVDDVKAFAIRYLGLAAVSGVLVGWLNFDSFTIGVWLTTIFGAVVMFLGPVLLATITMHFIKKEF